MGATSKRAFELISKIQSLQAEMTKLTTLLEYEMTQSDYLDVPALVDQAEETAEEVEFTQERESVSKNKSSEMPIAMSANGINYGLVLYDKQLSNGEWSVIASLRDDVWKFVSVADTSMSQKSKELIKKIITDGRFVVGSEVTNNQRYYGYFVEIKK